MADSDTQTKRLIFEERPEPQKAYHRSPAELVAWLVEEIRSGRHENQPRHQLMFYELVRAGSMQTTRQVLQKLKDDGLEKDLDWAIGRLQSGSETEEDTSALSKVLRTALFMALFVTTLLLSPVFYAAHAMAKSLYDVCRTPLLKAVDLPIMFAVLSDKTEMMELFLEFGTSVTYRDRSGNGFFHYLAEVSADDVDLAMKAHHVLYSHGWNPDKIHDCLLYLRNDNGEIGLEAITKYGALHFMEYIGKYHGTFANRLQFVISDDVTWIRTKDAIFDIRKEEGIYVQDNHIHITNPSAFSWEPSESHTEEVTSRMISKTLNLLANRRLRKADEATSATIIYSSNLNAWYAAKRKTYFVPCLLGHFVSFALSVIILVFIIQHEGDMRQSPMASHFYRKYYEMSAHNETVDTEFIIKNLFEECEEKLTYDEIRHSVYGAIVKYEPKSSPFTKNTALVLTVTHIIFALARIATFVWNNVNSKARHWKNMLTPLVSYYLPGSYTEKQLVMSSLCLIVTAVVLRSVKHEEQVKFLQEFTTFQQFRDGWMNGTITYEEYRHHLQVMNDIFLVSNMISGWYSVVFIVCLVLRFLLTVHALRLVPGIGFYIITIKQMANDLLRFAIILLIVIPGFAMMLHFTLRSSTCPAMREEGYGSTWDSMHNTYSIVMGGGEAEVLAYNLSTRTIYLACTFLVVVLLMNLVIALMTTTATEISSHPKKAAICRQEILSEILGTEDEVLLLLKPIKLIKKVFKSFNGASTDSGSLESVLSESTPTRIVYYKHQHDNDV